MAITAIIQNRAEVERKARGRAEEIARQYGKELERSWGGLLMWQGSYARLWSDDLVQGAGAWPGSEERTQWEASAARSPALSPQAQLAEWRSQYPGLRPEDVFPNSFKLTAEGRFRPGLEFNPAPQPPAWFTGLSAAQRAAWESLEAAASSGGGVEEIQQRLARFARGPSPPPDLAGGCRRRTQDAGRNHVSRSARTGEGTGRTNVSYLTCPTRLPIVPRNW